MILATLLLIATIPQIADWADLDSLSPSDDIVAIRARIQHTGVFVLGGSLDEHGASRGETLEEEFTQCNADDRSDHYPFEDKDRFTSKCTGYFVADSLFLTAAHCLSDVVDDIRPLSKNGKSGVTIATGYFSPTSTLTTHYIGKAAYSSRMGTMYSPRNLDWVFIETCQDHGDCGRNSDRLQLLLEKWLSSQSAAKHSDTISEASRSGYLISAPLGFHFHLITGHYWFARPRGISIHSIPTWKHTSGAPLFDAVSHEMIGIVPASISGSQFPSCGEVDPHTNQRTISFQSPFYRPQHNGYLPIEYIARELRSHRISFDPREAKEFRPFRSASQQEVRMHSQKKKEGPLQPQPELDALSMTNSTCDICY